MTIANKHFIEDSDQKSKNSEQEIWMNDPELESLEISNSIHTDSVIQMMDDDISSEPSLNNEPQVSPKKSTKYK